MLISTEKKKKVSIMRKTSFLFQYETNFILFPTPAHAKCFMSKLTSTKISGSAAEIF